MENLQTASSFCDEGIALSNSYGARSKRISAYQAKYEFLKAAGRFKEALNYHEKLLSLNDSVVKAMKDKELMNMFTKYEMREKDQELELSSRLLQQRTSTNRLILIFGGGILLGALIFIVSRLRTNRKLRAQKELIEKSLTEKELLLREIHHRVKNNLQVISSILSIQSRGIKDKEALKAVNESRARVKSMALIHQDLYGEDNLKGISAQTYITKLSNSLFNSYRVDTDRVRIETEVEDLLMDVDTSVPIGLILNELVTNSLKYAFPGDRQGEIRVELKEVDDSLRLTVADNGVGIPEEKKAASEDSFGMKMIKAFSKKLDAQWEIITDKGTTVKLVINNYHLVN
ncbi:MAG: sensor histidine kinase [Flavobacteriales bacterium]|nr:sensor histidine kinase [Flavobacteriales bacterium]